MINPVWLKTFVTLVDVGHFTRAADSLHMTQSGVSQQVKKLEEHLSVELLMREGKRFSLTDRGQKLYQEAKRLLESLNNLERKVIDDPPYEGRVSIMSPGSVGLKLYPQLLDLQQSHKELVLEYRFASNEDVEVAVLEDRIDFGLMTYPAKSLDVVSSQLAEEALLLVTPAEFCEVTWQNLLSLGLVDHPDGKHHTSLLLSANFEDFQHVGQIPQKAFSNQISLILEPVSRGIGFAVLPNYAVKAFAKQDLIRVHSLSNRVTEPLYLVQRKGRLQPNRVKYLMSEVYRSVGCEKEVS
ncbi:LysR family transcriptional regulator [Marinomonas posidonica]|uniref:LysR family transcriptional regulator n=1 Tax=Marinomonas posidonica TaxID=936476 RepID=UPI00373688FA